MKPWAGVPCIKTIGGVDVPTLKCLEAVYKQILNIAISLGLLALFIMLIVGGFKLLTAAGDPKAAASAKQTMTYAVMGIALMAIAFLIFRIIEFFTGVKITIFTVPGT